jgi:16S rRNA C967 or C1407 C5-methylase (RsmB/RsmF family)
MDEGSQLIAAALEVEAGDVVLDLCAGNGGKSLAIAGRLHESYYAAESAHIAGPRFNVANDRYALGSWSPAYNYAPGKVICYDIESGRLKQLAGIFFEAVGTSLTSTCFLWF